ncbi:N-acetylmuramoyl-L-alanine amidase [Natranaerovirga pectinivora]|uniref:N-acetylmuramoyl-L-alanine amidase n=1 Tax=Natranaerovirga pectinivora TaxID=682400 RepID=A0A4R3MMQ7_9FIRM|nr:cell wall hydrolase [Natranaerovirga pectinivora]TCT15545.1 N-acetylmuramoyl-L-alanine amidase [Natranaerovirga pectinivora]
MLKIQTLLQNVYSAFKSISKKAYKNCFVITTGSLVITVISLGSTSFDGGGKNRVTAFEANYSQEYIYEEEEEMEAKVLTELQGDEIISQVNDGSTLLSAEVRPRDVVLLSQENTEMKQEVEVVVEEEIEPVISDKLIQLSSKDYEALLKIVEAEATGEDIKGKILVANVVLNRVECSNFPSSIYDVIHDRNGGVQFSPIADGRYYSVPVTDDTRIAVERALNGEDFSDGALFFVARALASPRAVSWFDNNLTKVLQHGVHEFYR